MLSESEAVAWLGEKKKGYQEAGDTRVTGFYLLG
jgi:hypothetical protein